MKKLFLDTNVIIDLLGERENFYESAAKIASLADLGVVKILVSSLSYSTTFYILSKFEASEIVKDKLRKFKILAKTVDLTDKIIDKSLISDFKDFEDALHYFCAVEAKCDYIITRNKKDFKNSEIKVYEPDEFLSYLADSLK